MNLSSLGQRLGLLNLPSKSPTPRAQKELEPDAQGGDRVELSPKSLRRKRTLGSKLGLALCLTAAISGCASVPGPTGLTVHEMLRKESPYTTIDDKLEEQLLEQGDACGRIAPLSKGVPGRGAHLSIHGMGTGPQALQPLTDKAKEAGQSTSAFIYDDMHCTQKENGEALATSVKAWASEHQAEKLTIDTHSLGGRVVLEALSSLKQEGAIPEQAIDLNLIAPPIGGFGVANIALGMPSMLAKLIPGAAPSQDMASWSSAQETIESVSLPSNIETEIFYGSEDHLINYNEPSHGEIAKNLDADVYYVAGAGHETISAAVANNPKSEFSREVLSYTPSSSISGFFLQ